MFGGICAVGNFETHIAFVQLVILRLTSSYLSTII